MRRNKRRRRSKKTFGYHPIGVWCDNTREFLAATLRTGRAGSNTAIDHIEVLAAAIAQVPAAQRKNLLIRSDGAGASHKLLDWLTEQGQIRGRTLQYSVGYAVTEKIREAIKLIPKDRPACWGFAIYRASHGDYEDSFLPTGSVGGTAEDALDTACGPYLNDPTACPPDELTEMPTSTLAGPLTPSLAPRHDRRVDE